MKISEFSSWTCEDSDEMIFSMSDAGCVHSSGAPNQEGDMPELCQEFHPAQIRRRTVGMYLASSDSCLQWATARQNSSRQKIALTAAEPQDMEYGRLCKVGNGPCLDEMISLLSLGWVVLSIKKEKTCSIKKVRRVECTHCFQGLAWSGSR